MAGVTGEFGDRIKSFYHLLLFTLLPIYLSPINPTSLLRPHLFLFFYFFYIPAPKL